MKTTQKFFSILLSFIMIMGVFTIIPVTVQAQDAIPYVDAAGNPQTPVTEFTVVDNNTRVLSGFVDEEERWYAVTDDVEINDRIAVYGAVNLILCSDTTLTAHNGIMVEKGKSLTIWQQSSDTDHSAGKLIVDQVYDEHNAGIGGRFNDAGGYITINGGDLNITGGINGAGIGGGDCNSEGMDGSGSVITINGGTVTATGGELAAGIGGGKKGSGGNITINGGTVTATGGEFGAGIGGGYHGSGGNITINGGTVTAAGGLNNAAIGGGNEGSGGNITINGGEVSANKYGIGCCCSYSGSEETVITLNWTDASKDTMSVYAWDYRGTVNIKKPFRYDEPWGSGIIEAADDADASKLSYTLTPYERVIPSSYTLDLPETITLTSGAEWTAVCPALTQLDFKPDGPDGQSPDWFQIEYVGGTLTNTSDSSQTLLFEMGYETGKIYRRNVYFNLNQPGDTRFRIHISPADYNMAPYGTYSGEMTVITRWRYGRTNVNAATVTVPVTLFATGGIPGSTPVILLGDADGNGEVDIVDATVIQRYDVRMTDLSDYAKTRADVDSDGEVTILDATWIQRWEIGMKAPEGIGKQIDI